MREIRIPAFAKVNLRLEILGKRADGYHELRTIFQTISLHDELRLRKARSSAISLTIRGNEMLSHEPLHKNLVYAAVDALRRELKIRSGVEIDLRKVIPAGRGLGGGSSDAADEAHDCGGAAGGDRWLIRRGCAVLSVRRARARSQPRGRNLSFTRYPQAGDSGNFAA